MIHRPREATPPLFAGTANRLGCTYADLAAAVGPGTRPDAGGVPATPSSAIEPSRAKTGLPVDSGASGQRATRNDAHIGVGLARADHPLTAHAAAGAIGCAKTALQRRLLDCLAGGGLTDEEMQDRTGMNPSTQRPRRVELVNLRQVRDSGRRRQTRDAAFRKDVPAGPMSRMTRDGPLTGGVA